MRSVRQKGCVLYMKKYRVKFRETLTVYVDVVAENREAAKEEVERRVEADELNAATDFDDVERSYSVVRILSN